MPLGRTNIFLTILVLILFLNVFTINVNINSVQAIPRVSVEPSDQTVGRLDWPLPTSPFSINITVDSVSDMYAWEVVLYYNSSIISYDSASLPPGHVFDGKSNSPTDPLLDTDSKGDYVVFGAFLLGVQPGYSGSGTLCQITFVGQAKGTSSLRMDITTDPPPGGPVGYYTYLLDSNLNDISPIDIVNGHVTVVSEVQKPHSSITIDVDRDSVPLGSNVTVSGHINVTRAGLPVTISFRAEGTAPWYELTEVSTDATGHYVYPWNTTDCEVKPYELKSSWLGNTDFEGAESGTVTVTVSKKTSTISIIVHPTNVTAGSRVEISGAIIPNPASSTLPGVTISVRLVNISWTGNWTLLDPERQPVQTGLDGNYTFIWTTNTVGSYELMASWPGDLNYEGAESITKAVEVTPAPPFDIMAYLPYIIAAVAIVAIVGVAVYLIKFRKR